MCVIVGAAAGREGDGRMQSCRNWQMHVMTAICVMCRVVHDAVVVRWCSKGVVSKQALRSGGSRVCGLDWTGKLDPNDGRRDETAVDLAGACVH
jgi:hypothetical protein